MLEPALEKERALAPHERPTGAGDEALTEAASHVAAARRQLASGQAALAADTVEGLNRSTADAWPRRAPVRGQVAGAARTAHTLHGVLRQLGEAGGRPVTDTAEAPDRACADPTVYHRLGQLAVDAERHAFLLRCPDCGTLYEVFPEEKRPARELTVDEARALFPGAL